MTCSTCRQFRQGVVAHLGFCAVDRAREPLSGDEIRACWQPPAQAEPVVGLFAMVEQMHAVLRAPEHLQPAVVPQPSRTLLQVLTRAPEARFPDSRPGDAHGQPQGGDARRREPARRMNPDRGRPAEAVRLPEPRPVGRLLEAPLVAPAMRLGSRGDARSLREADEAQATHPAAPASALEPAGQHPAASSVDGEGLRALDGGAVL